MNVRHNLFIFVLISLLGINLSCKDAEQPQFVFPEDILLKEGDIVFRLGRSLSSQAVLAADKSGYYSHIGVVVFHEDKWQVVHAVPDEPEFEGDVDRVKMEEINAFFGIERAKKGAVVRLENDTLAMNAADKAKEILGKGMLFDHEYDLDDSGKMYCTELVYYIYNVFGLDLTEGRRSKVNIPGMKSTYIFPSDIYKNQVLNEIYSF